MFTSDSACKVYDRNHDPKTRRIHEFVTESNHRLRLLRGGRKFSSTLQAISPRPTEPSSHQDKSKISCSSEKVIDEYGRITVKSVDPVDLEIYTGSLIQRMQNNGAEMTNDNLRKRIERNSVLHDLKLTNFGCQGESHTDSKLLKPYERFHSDHHFEKPLTDQDIKHLALEKFSKVKNQEMKAFLVGCHIEALRNQCKRKA